MRCRNVGRYKPPQYQYPRVATCTERKVSTHFPKIPVAGRLRVATHRGNHDRHPSLGHPRHIVDRLARGSSRSSIRHPTGSRDRVTSPPPLSPHPETRILRPWMVTHTPHHDTPHRFATEGTLPFAQVCAIKGTAHPLRTHAQSITAPPRCAATSGLSQ